MPVWTQQQRQANMQRLLDLQKKKQAQALPNPNAPMLSDTRREAAPTPRSTGTTEQKPVAQAAPTTPIQTPASVQTYEQIGKGLANSEYDISKTEKQLYGDVKTAKTMDEYFQNLIQEQKKEKAAQEDALKRQSEQDLYSAQQQHAAIISQGEAAKAATAQAPEGAISASAMDIGTRLKNLQQVQAARLSRSFDMAEAERQRIQEKLDFAEKQGRRDLVQQYQGELNAATIRAQEAEAGLIQSLTQQQQTMNQAQAQKAAVTQAGIETFQSMVESGVTMDYNTVKMLADQYGLPTDMLMGYYQGADAIRNDKAMDTESKALALDQLKYQFGLQKQGLDNAAATAIRGLNTLRMNGASEEEIAAYKQINGITDYDDPLTQAKLALEQAQAKIAYNTANGILNNPLDLIDLAQKTYDYWNSMGYTAGSVPTGGEYGAMTYTTENGLPGIHVNVEQGQSLDVSGTERDEGQCGAFVNDFFGKRMFGNTFEEKMGLVDRSIKVPEPGMAFVMETESDYGHVGIVEYVDPTRGVMGVVDANWNNDGKVQRREIPITSASGFVRPPESVPANAELSLMDVPEEVRSAVMTRANEFNNEPLVKNFQTIQEGYNYMSSLDLNNLSSTDNQSIIYAFAKIMDPNSVVRESEYETVQRYAQSLASTYGFNAKRILDNTEFLSKEAVQNMIDTVQDRYNTSKSSYDNTRNEFARTINNIAGGVNVADSLLQDYSINQTSQPAKLSQDDLIYLYDNGALQQDEIDAAWEGTYQAPAQTPSYSRGGGMGIGM